MSLLLGRYSALPPSAPVPLSPQVDPNAEKERQAAENAALAESKAAGRRSTMVAGMSIAADEQGERGMLSSKRRAAAKTLGG